MKEMMGILKIDENNNVTYEQNHEVDTNRLKEFFFYAIAQFVIHKNVNVMNGKKSSFFGCGEKCKNWVDRRPRGLTYF